MEVRGYVVNGQRHGFSAAANVVAALETDNCLISRAGALVTTPAVIVTNAQSGNELSGDEALAFGGGQYLLLYVAPYLPVTGQPELAGVFLSPATGQTSGTSVPIAISITPGGHHSPAAGFDGTNFLAVGWTAAQPRPG